MAAKPSTPGLTPSPGVHLVFANVHRVVAAVNSVATEAVSLGLGAFTGWVFERRATKRARLDNEDLTRQISALQTRVASLGGRSHQARPAARPPRDLAALMTERAIATQDANGRVSRDALVAHFLEREYSAQDIDGAIESLRKAGITKEDGRWLQITG